MASIHLECSVLFPADAVAQFPPQDSTHKGGWLAQLAITWC